MSNVVWHLLSALDKPSAVCTPCFYAFVRAILNEANLQRKLMRARI